MYFPYFRGKQFELIAVRELAEGALGEFCKPVIEPVRASTAGLEKVSQALIEHEQSAVIVVNPRLGDHADGGQLSEFLTSEIDAGANVDVGIVVSADDTIESIRGLLQRHRDHSVSLLHFGFNDPKGLARLVGEFNVTSNIFMDGLTGKLYRRNFQVEPRVLIRDGFEKRRNKDHPEEEFFSDLHVTYEEEGMSGFGDFLTVGSEFSESGGPAYAVAIHLTFVDPDRDEEMWIHHYVSDTQDTPSNPAGKFHEALEKLIRTLEQRPGLFLETSAIRQLRELHASGHFPGLGYLKKLSMKHHVETLVDFLRQA